jgi:hypothetical protein
MPFGVANGPEPTFVRVEAGLLNFPKDGVSRRLHSRLMY